MKKIEFDRVVIRDMDGDEVVVKATPKGETFPAHIAIRFDGSHRDFTDPAALEALAEACKRAAEALRKAKRLTAGDLKPFDWFRFIGRGFNSVHACRMCIDGKTYTQLCVDGGGWCGAIPVGEHEDAPVIRLKATFEEVPDER